jgi:hypothetical protein
MKSKTEKYHGVQKQIIRNLCSTPNKKYKSILDLPGKECHSVKHFQTENNISTQTKILCVEHKANFCEEIERKISRLGLAKQTTIFQGRAEKCPHLGPFDLVNLDTCSHLSENMLSWIANLKFIANGELNVWVTTAHVSLGFKNALYRLFYQTKEGQKLYNQIESDNHGVFKNIDPFMAVSACAIRCVLNKFKLRVELPVEYTEHVNRMHMFRFTHINPGQEVNIDFFSKFEINENEKASFESSRANNKLSGNIVNMCRQIVETKNSKNYLVRMIRSELKSGSIEGKDPKWIKAGWKSFASKNYKQEPSLVKEIHQLIDSA